MAQSRDSKKSPAEVLAEVVLDRYLGYWQSLAATNLAGVDMMGLEQEPADWYYLPRAPAPAPQLWAPIDQSPSLDGNLTDMIMSALSTSAKVTTAYWNSKATAQEAENAYLLAKSGGVAATTPGVAAANLSSYMPYALALVGLMAIIQMSKK